MLFYRNGGSTKKLELKFVMDYGIRSVNMSCFTPLQRVGEKRQTDKQLDSRKTEKS